MADDTESMSHSVVGGVIGSSALGIRHFRNPGRSLSAFKVEEVAPLYDPREWAEMFDIARTSAREVHIRRGPSP